MIRNDFIQDNGLFSEDTLDFRLPDSFETIANLFNTVKQYREYAKPETPAWEEYNHEVFHVLGFHTNKIEARILSLGLIGKEKEKPKALVCLIRPEENFTEIIPDIKWVSHLFYIARYHEVEWGILTNGVEIKIFNFGKKTIPDAFFWCNLDGILENNRLDSFFTIYKIFVYIKGLKSQPVALMNVIQKQNTTFVPPETIVVGDYDLNYHLQKKTNSAIDLFEALRVKVFSLSPLIIEKFRKKYIGYSEDKNFCEVHVLSDHLKIWVDVAIEDIHDPEAICRNVSQIGHYGTGDVELLINNVEDVGKVFAIVQQAYHHRTGTFHQPLIIQNQ